MDDVRSRDLYTRRAALALATMAIPAFSQSPESSKPGVTGGRMANPIVHFEIGCRKRAKTEKFFSDLFGCQMKPMGLASEIDTGTSRGIPGHITELGHEPFHYTLF